MNKIESLKWSPAWTTTVGCLRGCADVLGIDVSDAWLSGATGHAFVMNIHDVLCPSGPKPWQTLGDTGIGVLNVSVVRRVGPANDNTADEDKEKRVKDKARCRKALVALAAARSAEQAGLEALAKVE